METATTVTKPRSRANRDRKSAAAGEMGVGSGAKIIGEVVAWETRAGAAGIPHRSVIDALKAYGLDETVAREIAPTQAFHRASKKMEAERSIDVVRSDSNEVVFQFTRKFIEGHDEETRQWSFAKETNVVLNKTTGKIACKNADVQALAQRELDNAVERRTSSDITAIVQRLFENQADLFAIRSQGGAYFVPIKHQEFTDRVHKFLQHMSGDMQRFPIAAGTKRGAESVANAVATSISALIAEHESAIEDFSYSTRPETFESAAERIRNTRVKLEAYTEYLMDRKGDLEKALQAADERLRAEVARITAYRSDNPTEGLDKWGARVGSQTSKVNRVLMEATEPLTMKKIQELAEVEKTFYNHCNAMVREGYAIKVGSKFIARPESCVGDHPVAACECVACHKARGAEKPAEEAESTPAAEPAEPIADPKPAKRRRKPAEAASETVPADAPATAVA